MGAGWGGGIKKVVGLAESKNAAQAELQSGQRKTRAFFEEAGGAEWAGVMKQG